MRRSGLYAPALQLARRASHQAGRPSIGSRHWLLSAPEMMIVASDPPRIIGFRDQSPQLSLSLCGNKQHAGQPRRRPRRRPRRQAGQRHSSLERTSTHSAEAKGRKVLLNCRRHVRVFTSFVGSIFRTNPVQSVPNCDDEAMEMESNLSIGCAVFKASRVLPKKKTNVINAFLPVSSLAA